jgi:predicted site-specific integrase-resolvase
MPKPKQPAAEPRPVAVYIRVSSKDQKTDSQCQSILDWLTRNGYDLDQAGWYVDVESGRMMKRPEFDRLRADIFAGTIKAVVVSKVDRIARRSRPGAQNQPKRPPARIVSGRVQNPPKRPPGSEGPDEGEA